jgi:hypothetical protein
VGTGSYPKQKWVFGLFQFAAVLCRAYAVFLGFQFEGFSAFCAMPWRWVSSDSSESDLEEHLAMFVQISRC